MVVSRRSFIKKGTLLVLAAGVSFGEAKNVLGSDSSFGDLVPQEGLPVSKGSSLKSLELKRSTFEPYVNTVFQISDGTKVVNSTLVSVADIGPVRDQKIPGRECFVIKFKGARPLTQNTYKLEHEALGTFDLFLVPAGRNRKGCYYQAVVNRLNA